MKLALFDLDHTLLNTDSDHSWGEFLVNEGLVDPVYHRAMNDKFYGQSALVTMHGNFLKGGSSLEKHLNKRFTESSEKKLGSYLNMSK